MKKWMCFLLTLALLSGMGICAHGAATEVPVTLSAAVLRPGCAGIYYKAELSDQADAAAWGVALSTAEMPNRSNLDTKCLYTRITDTNTANSALLTNVLDSTDAQRSAQNLTTTVYVRPYVETTDGQILFGEGAAHTFSDVLTAVDQKWEALTPAQQTGMVEMYTTHNAVMDPVKTPAIEEAYQESLTPPVTPDPPAGDTDTAPEAGTTQITVGLLTNVPSSDYDNNALTLWLEEQTGYDIIVQAYTGSVSSGNNTLNMMVTGAYDMPDILLGFVPTADMITTFGQEGYFVDLSKYYQDTAVSQSFWTAVNKGLSAQQKELILDKITEEDGKIYTVPTITTSATGDMRYQAWINTAWLEALNLEMPTNAQELYTVLKAFKEQDPNGNGKTDEIPLLGSQRVTNAKVVDWLINMFCYYDSENLWQPNGTQMSTSFLNSDYRAAMIYINKLYEEGLLFSGYATSNTSELRMLNSTGTAGVIMGNLYQATDCASDSLMDYAALPIWGNGVESAPTFQKNAFISGFCKNPNAAFKVLMTLYSKAGQERMRYGVYGTNWVEADPKTLSQYGVAAEYKVLSAPDTNSVWGKIVCTFDRGDDGSLVQLTGELTPLQQHLQTQTGLSRAAWDNAANPTKPPEIWLGSSSKSQTAIVNLVSQWQQQFITGAKISRYDYDYDWDEYWQALIDAGMNDITYQMLQEYKSK